MRLTAALATPGLFRRACGQGVEVLPEIGIAQAIDRPFATTEDFQQRGVGGAEGVQGAEAITILVNGSAEIFDRRPQRFKSSANRLSSIVLVTIPAARRP